MEIPDKFRCSYNTWPIGIEFFFQMLHTYIHNWPLQNFSQDYDLASNNNFYT